MAAPVVLGLDFGGSKIAAAVTDADGVWLGETMVEVEPASGAEHTFATGLTLAHRLLEDVAPEALLAAVGACTFGIPAEDMVQLAPNIDGWERLPFGRRLRDAFPGVPIRMATDVKAAARAELDDGALTGCRQGIYVNLGTGLAVALVVDGQVVRGSHEAAGEVGYSLRRPGEPPEAARLEEAVSGQALGAAAVRLLGRPNVAALFERAAVDPVAGDLVDDFLNELSFHLANLAIALDPERIVVGGGLVRSWDRLEPAISAALLAAPFPPELRLAAHPFDAPLRGALRLGRALITELPTVADVLSEGASA